MKNPRTPGHIVLYRWKIKPGLEDQFTASWSQVTQSLLERGSLGSRLHKGNDDTWYAYAQWPSNADREKAFAARPESPDQAKIREAILESFPPVYLEPVADFLLPTGTEPKAFDGE
jgi:hypothetical protein